MTRGHRGYARGSVATIEGRSRQAVRAGSRSVRIHPANADRSSAQIAESSAIPNL